jgi:hypothetical protein
MVVADEAERSQIQSERIKAQGNANGGRRELTGSKMEPDGSIG